MNQFSMRNCHRKLLPNLSPMHQATDDGDNDRKHASDRCRSCHNQSSMPPDMHRDSRQRYFSDNKKELVLKLINLNNKIEVFKKTVVSYTSESWSGSRIPLIEQKLEYVSLLANEIPNKITYIEHRSYLKELIEYYKLQIEEEKLREYVDEFFR